MLITEFLGKFIKLITCGSKHSIAVSSKNEVFAWGVGRSGRLGTGKQENEFSPATIQLPTLSKEQSITHIACGWSHSIVVAANSFVFTFGRGVNGGLGHGVEKVCSSNTSLADINRMNIHRG